MEEDIKAKSTTRSVEDALANLMVEERFVNDVGAVILWQSYDLSPFSVIQTTVE